MAARGGRRVLFLAYYFPPMGMGGVQRSAKFVKYLPANGWSPVVVTVKDVHYYEHDESLCAELGNAEIVRTESADPLRAWRRLANPAAPPAVRGSAAAAPPGFLRRANAAFSPWLFIPDSKIAWVPYAVRAAWRIHRRQPVDMIFTTSPPHSTHLAGLALRSLFKIPWIADFRDSWLGEAFDKVPTPLHQAANRALLGSVLRRADRIVGVSRPIVDDLTRLSGRSSVHFRCIPNGYDPEDFRGLAWKPSARFRITYCGTANPVHSPEDFFKALRAAFAESPSLAEVAEVRFVGSVQGLNLESLARRYGVDKAVRATGYLPHADGLRSMLDSDLLLLLLPANAGPGVVTGKLFEYLASGITILGFVPKGEADRLIRESGRGISVNPSETDTGKGAILSVFHSWNRKTKREMIFPVTDVPAYDRRRHAAELAGVFDVLRPRKS